MALLKNFQLKLRLLINNLQCQTGKCDNNNNNKLYPISPNREVNSKIPLSGISFANMYISKLLNSMPWSSDAHGRVSYANLSPAQKFKIRKKAAEIGETRNNAILQHLF